MSIKIPSEEKRRHHLQELKARVSDFASAPTILEVVGTLIKIRRLTSQIAQDYNLDLKPVLRAKGWRELEEGLKKQANGKASVLSEELPKSGYGSVVASIKEYAKKHPKGFSLEDLQRDVPNLRPVKRGSLGSNLYYLCHYAKFLSVKEQGRKGRGGFATIYKLAR